MTTSATLRDVTLAFLVKHTAKGEITHVYLAMKKRGFGAGRWNGTGGKVEEQKGESVAAAFIREAQQEHGIVLQKTMPVGTIDFYFPDNPKWNQRVYIRLVESWSGELRDSEEMGVPQEFPKNGLPLEAMWSGDKLWLPQVLEGQSVTGEIFFGENDNVLKSDLRFSELAEPVL